MKRKKIIAAICLIVAIVVTPIQLLAADHNHSFDTNYTENNQVKYKYCDTRSGIEPRTVLLPKNAYPESKHEYSNNANESYSYSVDNAKKLLVTFSDFTKTEEAYDVITISNTSGHKIGEFSGTQLAGKSVLIEDNGFSIDFITDRSKTFYGFSIDSIVAIDENNCQAVMPSAPYPESKHNYGNNENSVYTYSAPGASSLMLKLSNKIELENGYDFIYIYDENNNIVKKLTGKISSKDIDLRIDGSAFSVSLASDRSKTYYGLAIDEIVACYEDYTVLEKNDTYNYITPQVDYLATNHNYSNYQNTSYTYSYPNARSLSVTFSSATQTEQDYDFIYIYDGLNRLIGKYSGTQLASKTISIPTGSFKIKFTSDHSKTYYGFSIDLIEANVPANGDTTRTRYVTGSNMPESSHNYGNSIDETQYYYDSKAKSHILQFSSNTHTESKYDIIYIYNEDNGRLIGTYSGNELSGKRVAVNASSFSIRLKTDQSATYYGYSLDYIISFYESTHFDKNSSFYPESTHFYDNYADQQFEFVSQYPAVKSLEVKFSSKTETEKNYDFIYIYDLNDKLIGKYSGTELANKVVRIDAGGFRIKLTSDRSKAYYGFSIDSIVTSLDTDYCEKKELEHSYVKMDAVETTISHYGVEYYHCDNCGDEYRTIIPRLISISELKIYQSDTSYYYDGKAHKPEIKVYDKKDNRMIEGKDYTIDYSGDGIECGKYSINLTLTKEGYSGSKTLSYQVVPRFVSNIRIEPTLYSLYVYWTKATGRVDGYILQYSDYSDFRTYNSQYLSADTTQGYIGKLYQSSEYYVRIFSYVYNSKGEIVYSYAPSQRAVTNSYLKYYYNQNDYGDVHNPLHDYSKPSGEKKTIATSGCGVVSATIALNYLAGYEYYSVPELAKFSKNCGARDNYGTNLYTLLDSLMRYNKRLTYRTSSDSNELLRHIRNGGVAIINQNDYLGKHGYPLFSINGHFVVGYATDSNRNVYVADPAYTDVRYKSEFCIANIERETVNGCLVNVSIIEKATAPVRYYLLSYK